AELFEYLAGEEERHVEAFTEMKQGLEGKTLPESYPGETEAYIAGLIGDKVFPSEADVVREAEQTADANEAIDRALEMERRSILLYAGIRDLVRESEQHIMDQIIDEERQHIRKLLELRHSLSSQHSQ
ncbi:MAG: hypothetical protein J7M38_02470, partial [Armatimonadetes bacterium]|nr:hypothetical protein [Armatimonadota bacterium]